ncbi:glycerol-3-phosphate regulon repressor [Aliidongia dinghuensis]|uniref:Glycerol-3-phosphate regulon repressor n=1 Tax=Aliidongia dinghuensis TaxID=1867774 RepID=A0A8J3E520_9PROT|nr:DeoR/GlpR family DNA-binding transcription regulator [Aliidongia dinghuensis]GGF31996.1 glycerol-3-phosphate regulon repressor [Aliidongia dinghuensis]
MTTTNGMADEITPRQREIVEIVGEKGFATIEALAQHFSVSTQSIRRDIIQLDKTRLLQRFHGGAGATDTTVRLGYAEKHNRAAEGKVRIGKAAAALVPDGASVFLDVGTTVEAVARELRNRGARCRAFTTSLATAMILAGHGDIELHVFGGTSRGPDGSLVGAETVAAIGEIHFDCAVLGLSGFDADGAPMDFDLDKIAVKRAALRRADRTIAVGDATKFGRRAVARIAPLEDIRHLVANEAPPATLAAACVRAGVDLVVG